MNAVTKRNPVRDAAIAEIFERLEAQTNLTFGWGSGTRRREIEGDRSDYTATRYRENGNFREEHFETLAEAAEWLLQP
jgi:hypothetical protein